MTEPIRNPVFIIGCGRSGTTILGKALSRHSKVTYLNEPRHLWFSAYPESDIWTPMADSRNGKLVLSEEDANEWRSIKLSQLFSLETIKTNKPILVEKLPINSFRLGLIHKVFPDARFIFIYRNGLEVSRSIEKLCIKGKWFGSNFYKWNKLVEYALTREETAFLPGICSNFFLMGLLEWRLSNEAAIGFLSNLPEEAFVELSYDHLISDPIKIISKILLFLGIEEEMNVVDFVKKNILRRSSKIGIEAISRQEQTIGGKLLFFSMDTERRLTPRCVVENYFSHKDKIRQ